MVGLDQSIGIADEMARNVTQVGTARGQSLGAEPSAKDASTSRAGMHQTSAVRRSRHDIERGADEETPLVFVLFAGVISVVSFVGFQQQ